MTNLPMLLLLALPLHARPRAPLPQADALILKALAGPATGYRATERVQVFLPEHKPKALKEALIGGADGRVRREVSFPRKHATIIGVERPENPAAGLARLKSVYELSVSTGGAVAKRKTWRVDLRLKSGVLRRTLWVDRDSGLLMKRETYRDDGSLRKRERLVKLELPVVVSENDFPAEAVARGPWLPEGFAPAGEGRYTNGLESFVLKDGRASGDIAEDDAARVESAWKR